MVTAQKQGQSRIDSLLGELPRAQEDTNKVLLLDNISYEYYQINPAEGIKYGNQVLALSRKLKWDRGMAHGYSDLGTNYESLAEHTKALQYYMLAAKVYHQSGDRSSIAGNTVNIGVVYMAQSDYPHALQCFFLALGIYEELGDRSSIALIQGNIGTIYLAQKNYPQALTYFTNALRIYNRLGNREGIARLSANIGIVQDAYGKYQDALASHLKAFRINSELGNTYAIQLNLANIGYVYNHIGNYDSALRYQFMALDISRRLGDKSSVAVNLGNIGETYYTMAQDGGSGAGGKKAALTAAIKYLGEAIDLCREINFSGPQIEFSQYLSDAYFLWGDYRQAFEQLKDYKHLSDSIYSVQSKVEIATLEADRQIALKNKDLQIKEKEILIRQLAVEKQKDERVLMLVSIILLVLIIGIVLRSLYVYRNSNRRLYRDNMATLALLKEAQQLAKVGNWNVDFVKDRIYWSDEMREILGIDPKQELGYDTFIGMVHPADRVDVIEKIQHMRATGATYEHIFRIVKPDGAVRVLKARTRHTIDTSGKQLRVFGIVHDITELQQAESTLKKSEANIRTVFNNTEAVYVLLDKDLRLVSFNQPAVDFAAIELQTSLAEGECIMDKFPKERSAAINGALQRVLEGETVKYEVWYERSGVWYDAQYFPVLDDHNEVNGIVMAALDITGRKESEKQTLELVDRLQKRNRDLSQFAYIISHNLRAPIAKILGLTSLFSDDPAEAEENRTLVKYIADEAAGLDTVIADINTIITARDAGHIRETASFERKMQLIHQVIGHHIAESGAVITKDFEVKEIVTVKGYLYSIMYNLVSNAVKYRAPDRPLHIHVSAKAAGDFVCLSVKDNGMGIDLNKNGEKLFGLYKRFHGEEIEGKGMGLYLVKTQTEALGGRVEVTSTVNEGTCFLIYLPC